MRKLGAVSRISLVIVAIVVIVIIVAAVVALNGSSGGKGTTSTSQSFLTTSVFTTPPSGASSAISFTTNSQPPSSATSAPNLVGQNFISISGGMSLCASNCLYPSPSLAGTLFVNATVPLRTLQLSINGTFENTSTYNSNLTSYAIAYKDSPKNQSLSIVAGKVYFILLVATFQDNSQSTANTFVTATSGSTTTSA
jgi:hypothetical protein